uniref:Uncharacterized protein n=1 Tax=Panagrellus redivivus TaxID=6233 RepID=A0A7E4VXR8_PANRE
MLEFEDLGVIVGYVVFAVLSILLANTCIKRRQKSNRERAVVSTPTAPATVVVTPTRVTSPASATCTAIRSPSTEPLKRQSRSREQPPTSMEVQNRQSREHDPFRPAKKLPSAEVIPLVGDCMPPSMERPKKKEDSDEVMENADLPVVIDQNLMQRPPGHLDLSSKSGRQNYHVLEPSNLEALCVDFWAILVIPIFLPISNFWKSFDVIAQTPDLPRVVPSNFIVISIRDLVSNKEPVLASMAGRLLEPIPINLPITETKTEHSQEDGTNSTISTLAASGVSGPTPMNVRIFITFYDPITIEIHFTGKTAPNFIWKILGPCAMCEESKRLFETAGNFIGVDNNYPTWKDLVCQVGQMPGNRHTFISAMKPNSEETEIYHVMVIKGDKSIQGHMAKCSLGCKADSSKWHPHRPRILPLYRAHEYRQKQPSS